MLFSELELAGLASKAISFAERLEDAGKPAQEACGEVIVLETQLSRITSASSVPGGIARVGAVCAAIAAGRRQEAARLAEEFSEGLSEERRAAMAQAMKSMEATSPIEVTD